MKKNRERAESKSMNYRLDIEYDGSRYEGWQRQNRTTNTIQGKIEEVLSKMCETPIEIDGAGYAREIAMIKSWADESME